MAVLNWAGGEHEFKLAMGHFRALQEKCDAGPYFVMQRLASGAWLVDDVIQPIRLGLEGGGMDKAEALRLTRRHVEERPLLESVLLAHRILQASLLGEADDPVGESAAGAGSDPSLSPAAKSAGPA